MWAADEGPRDFAGYGAEADADLVGIGLIEDDVAIHGIDALLAHARPNAIMPGPGDLATSMGLPGQPRVRYGSTSARWPRWTHGPTSGPTSASA